MFNIVSSTLTVSRETGLPLHKHFYYQVSESLAADDQQGKRLVDFDPRLVFSEVLTKCEDRPRKNILKRYLSLFSQPDHIGRDDRAAYTKSLLQQFAEHRNWLDATTSKGICEAIAQNYFHFETLSVFVGKYDEQKAFISEGTLSKYVDNISANDVEQPDLLKKEDRTSH